MPNNQLTPQDIEHIERLMYKNADDISISIARSFERLEERIDSAESRIYSRLTDIEDKLIKIQDSLNLILINDGLIISNQ